MATPGLCTSNAIWIGACAGMSFMFLSISFFTHTQMSTVDHSTLKTHIYFLCHFHCPFVSHIFYNLGVVGKFAVELLRCTKSSKCYILFLVCMGAIHYLKVTFWRICTSKCLPIKIRITTIPRDKWIIIERNQRTDLNSNISSQPPRPASVRIALIATGQWTNEDLATSPGLILLIKHRKGHLLALPK